MESFINGPFSSSHQQTQLVTPHGPASHYFVRRLQELPLPQALSSPDRTQPAGQRFALETPPAPPRSFDGTLPPPLRPS
ncbi:hypothetical protein E2C01_005799 [Portunus trituberculatus]|uniref:Uncharacterized protein n=1 Tax=Portunus trituberculatus TaxID=210409 RepID=A0A5B7CUD3_PORTR|nr:hypothetical protein [Portunus trituberculatus]